MSANSYVKEDRNKIPYDVLENFQEKFQKSKKTAEPKSEWIKRIY